MKYKQIRVPYIFTQNKYGETIMSVNIPLNYVDKFIGNIKCQNYNKLTSKYTLNQNLTAEFLLNYFIRNIFNRISLKNLLPKVANHFNITQYEIENIIKNMIKIGIISIHDGYINVNILCRRRKVGYINIIE